MLATIDSDVQNVTITEEQDVNFACNFSKRDVNITVYWTVDGGQYDCIEEEDIGSESIECYNTETQSVLLIKNSSSLTPGSYEVQCILRQNIPEEFRNDMSFNDTFNNITRRGLLTIMPIGESVTC